MMRGTALIRFHRVLKLRMAAVRGREEGVAMMTAILFMIIMAGIASVLLGVVSSQMVPTYIDQKGTKTIYSAQAGIQAALSVMRAAGTLNINGKVYGDPSKLPCAFTGSTNGTSDGNQYSVSIQYFTTDPTTMTTAQKNANALTCTTGTAAQYGTSSYGLTTTPLFALITSAGTASQIAHTGTVANRTITALYTFQYTNLNIAGGLIYDAGDNVCMQAVSATVGSLVIEVAAANCSSQGTNAALQLWSYNSNYQLVLASSLVNNPPGLCITGPAANGQATQNVTLQTCDTSTTDTARWNQLWSWTGSYTWDGENPTVTGFSNYWISPGTDKAGGYLQVSSGTNGTMAPTSQVGPGAASYTTYELINYQQFGRCADVTGEQINATAMIAYPCKQDPANATGFTWNQKWYYCEPYDITARCAGVVATAQPIFVNYLDQSPAVDYCLTTPTTGNGVFPTFQLCDKSGDAVNKQQTWARYYNTGTYSTSYIIVDEYGRCLEANSADIYSGDISELTVTGCNGSDAQKWNAPPTYDPGDLGGYREISGG